MNNFSLYCCTYKKDLSRALRLATSVEKHNKDRIPFYISTPTKDIIDFKEKFKNLNVIIIDELEIIKLSPRIDFQKLYNVQGWIRQQVIKSEFWRLGLSKNYLVLDSDCFFIRDFSLTDFFYDDNTPYTVIHEGKDVLNAVSIFGPSRAREGFFKDREPIKNIFNRKGVTYDFGYAPFLWSSKVWMSLDANYLEPNNISLLDAILTCDSEFTWYGESLLKYKAIPIYPREQLFMHYHYEHQLLLHNLIGINELNLALNYMGIVKQSNWQTWIDYGQSEKRVSSRVLRSIKRFLKIMKFRFYILFRLAFKM